MPTSYERWIGHQVKARLELDRILWQNAPIPGMPQPLWNIITDYVHEDPRVVDAILSGREYRAKIPDACYQNWLELDHGQPYGRGHHSMSIDEYRIFPDSGALDCDDTYGEVFGLVLMLPVVDDSGNECERRRIPTGLVQLREVIYASLK
jgi:hypothetical protein